MVPSSDIQDVELCVPHTSFEEACSILESSYPCEPDELESFDLYTEYKQGWPRFRPTATTDATTSPTFGIVVFSDKYMKLDPLDQAIVPRTRALKEKSYSSQILESISARDVHLFPMPKLPRLMTSLCERYLESGDVMARIAIEQLVDGMDPDEAWCERNMSSAADEAQQLVLSIVQRKKFRIDDFSGKTITCFIADQEEVPRLHGIPGYEP
ncbi:uncharacterized protein J3D65DRAFT_17172 [Phyllosticta citribraziliensis]|uniref:Uncharacterized protein n=1 Tax=Phyllosticta citribraziliensis TaxID=989973 RepID=A0ABR1M921_9PEZI